MGNSLWLLLSTHDWLPEALRPLCTSSFMLSKRGFLWLSPWNRGNLSPAPSPTWLLHSWMHPFWGGGWGARPRTGAGASSFLGSWTKVGGPLGKTWLGSSWSRRWRATDMLQVGKWQDQMCVCVCLCFLQICVSLIIPGALLNWGLSGAGPGAWSPGRKMRHEGLPWWSSG